MTDSTKSSKSKLKLPKKEEENEQVEMEDEDQIDEDESQIESSKAPTEPKLKNLYKIQSAFKTLYVGGPYEVLSNEKILVTANDTSLEIVNIETGAHEYTIPGV